MRFLKPWKCLAACGLLLALNSCDSNQNVSTTPVELTGHVNPYIGTGGHGHVFLGANVPFGLVQLGPTQQTRGWDWCSGYHYSDSILVGFSHMHLSGTGIGDLGDITFFPTTDDRREHKFEHKFEVVKPGYYSVWLPEADIAVELTATARTGFHRYSFPKNENAQIIIDLKRGIGWDSAKEGYLVQENDTVVSGYRYSKGWARDQKIYFTAVFSTPIKGFKVSEEDQEYTDAQSITTKTAFAKLMFDTTQQEAICVKVGLSPTSIENAKLNLATEQPQSEWSMQTIADEATKAWDKHLNKIIIETSNETDKKIFYTALFHSMTAPSVFSDVNAEYTEYTTLSLWDTYRAAHPLATIIHPELIPDYGKTFLSIFNRQGKLPVWHLVGNETDCMVGNPGIAALADMVLKGYDVDKEAAFEAMKTSAMLDERGLKFLKEYDYIPYNLENESVAKGLEYALADWTIAQVAKELGKTEDYEYFLNRSKSYTHYFDKNTQFMRGLSPEGQFREPFNPFHSTHREDDYTEGNAWQYTWLVPHDVKGLVELFGSEDAFINKLDSLFVVEGSLGEGASPDISGLIGQYAHGNEPSHHIAYMYAYVGQPWKTAKIVREVLTTLYFNDPNGLSGNEDVGQMSSWYIMSALGFYQVAPAGGVYVFGSPLFDKATLQVGKNKTFQIIAHNNSEENIYIQSVKLNGKKYTKSYILHKDIVAGGKLEFEMGNQPSATFGVEEADRP
ncbi:GH92 family glycosyl hydrolase [Bacteroides sp. 224]|uniref:GH92 family glycosyl hydrolase n=1 Tax=Bacteroides sp. 224 TaxID=2302936 RepID=UPI0013D141C1|nr:GH92 family glycosyl hydrolase [Bacteroides sp. 224]NDV66930.1 glycoside hydrolase family 92 protein [Bacteroides sp. 224]